MSRGKKDPNAVALSAVFKGMPCAFLKTFQEAIGVAERLPEGCRIVWLWTDYKPTENHNYRVSRQPELCASQREDKQGSFTRRVWENGVIEVPEVEHASHQNDFFKKPKVPEQPTQEETPAPQPAAATPKTIREKAAKTCQKVDNSIGGSVFDLIEQLKKVGLSAEKILEVITGLGPNGTAEK